MCMVYMTALIVQHAPWLGCCFFEPLFIKTNGETPTNELRLALKV